MMMPHKNITIFHLIYDIIIISIYNFKRNIILFTIVNPTFRETSFSMVYSYFHFTICLVKIDRETSRWASHLKRFRYNEDALLCGFKTPVLAIKAFKYLLPTNAKGDQ